MFKLLNENMMAMNQLRSLNKEIEIMKRNKCIFNNCKLQ